MRTIKTTAVQEKAMSYIALDPQKWIQHAWDSRARGAIEEIVQDYSDKQPRKLSPAEKEDIVKKVKIKTAAQREKELEAEIRGRK